MKPIMILPVILMAVLVGCQKKEDGQDPTKEDLPTVMTTAVTNVTDNSATCGGNVTSEGAASVTARGVVWNTSQNPTLESCTDKTTDGSGTGTFTSTITGLTKGTTYYVRAYAVNSNGVGYGVEYPFTTTSSGVSVVTDSVFSLTSSSAKCAGTVTVTDPSVTVNMKGVVWSTSENPEASLSTKTQDGSGAGSFTGNISGLTAETTYYVRAYAVTSKDTCYGVQKSFTTEKGGGGGGDYPEAPGLECVTIHGVIWAPVNCGYDATNYPYGKLYQWGRKDGCGYDNTWFEGGTTKGPETVIQTITSGPVSASDEDASKFYKTSSPPHDWLSPQNDARWNSGTESSPVKTSYDPCPAGWRVPTAAELTSLLGSHIGGNLQAGTGVHSGMKGKWFDGSTVSEPSSGLFLPAAGLYYYDYAFPSRRGLYGRYWSSSSSVGGYYARGLGFDSGYADLSNERRAYGYSVRCVKESSSPIFVTTLAVTSITPASAVCVGTVSGSATVTARGVVWSTSQNPTLESCIDKTTDGSGTGTFTSNITGLTKGTTYYVRAYATSSDGQMAYGDQKSFKAEEGGGGSYPEAPGLECITINGIVWAPVNCGYDATNYPYGKLYQWGRKDGCGYGATWYEHGMPKGPEADIQTTTSGPVSASGEDASKFYKTSSPPNDWLSPQNDARWNSGTEAPRVKAQYDPCPAGWRVPTAAELTSLLGSHIGGNLQAGTGVHSGMKGLWFDGSTVSEPSSGLFLPAAGDRDYNGYAFSRDSYGYYWSSSVSGNARGLHFANGYAYLYNYYRAYGFSVRCVQE